MTHPTARGAAVTPQAAGRASKTHPRSEGARTPAGPSAAATAAGGRPARNGRTDGADLAVIKSAAASHHAPHPPDMHPAVITSEQAAPTTQRRKGPQRPHPRPRRRLYAAARSRATDAGLHVPPERRRQPTRPATPPDTHPTARLGAQRWRFASSALVLSASAHATCRGESRVATGVVCVWVICAAVPAEFWGGLLLLVARAAQAIATERRAKDRPPPQIIDGQEGHGASGRRCRQSDGRVGYAGPMPRPSVAMLAQAESRSSSLSVGGTKRRRAGGWSSPRHQRDRRPPAEYRLDSGNAMRLVSQTAKLR